MGVVVVGGPIIGETRYRSDDLAYRAFLPPRITTFGPSDVDDTGVSMPMGSTLVVILALETLVASGRTFGGGLRAEMPGLSRFQLRSKLRGEGKLVTAASCAVQLREEGGPPPPPRLV